MKVRINFIDDSSKIFSNVLSICRFYEKGTICLVFDSSFDDSFFCKINFIHSIEILDL